MDSMFNNCKKLEKLDLSSFNFDNVDENSKQSMLLELPSIKNIYVSSNNIDWIKENFQNCADKVVLKNN